jgi:hypothetical protein
MRVSKAHVKNLLASLLWLMMAGGTVLSCAWIGSRVVAPSDAPPLISGRMQPADDALPHQGIALGGRRYLGHEILAPAEGVVVRIRGDHVRSHFLCAWHGGLGSRRCQIY